MIVDHDEINTTFTSDAISVPKEDVNRVQTQNFVVFKSKQKEKSHTDEFTVLELQIDISILQLQLAKAKKERDDTRGELYELSVQMESNKNKGKRRSGMKSQNSRPLALPPRRTKL